MQNQGHHHLHVRKRIYKKLEAYPHPEAFRRLLDRLMVFIAIAGPLAALPQVYDVYTTHNVGGLSMITWVLWFLFSCVWGVYGFIHRETPIVIANALSAVLQGTIIAAILVYG